MKSRMRSESKEIEELYFETAVEWRDWLTLNFKKVRKVWLVYYKKHTNIRSISYNEAVEEALCFGWIDSKVNKIDDQRFKQIFTPRNPKSVWSKINRERVEKLISLGKMTADGMKLVEDAKKSGWWEKAYSSQDIALEIPEDFIEELKKDSVAFINFNTFSNTQKAIYIHWINNAKRPETRINRIFKVIDRSNNNLKPGM